MKVILNKSKQNKTIGWSLVAENIDDKLTLGSIRNIEFWGSGDDVIKYDGIKSEETKEGTYVTEVKYTLKSHK